MASHSLEKEQDIIDQDLQDFTAEEQAERIADQFSEVSNHYEALKTSCLIMFRMTDYLKI